MIENSLLAYFQASEFLVFEDAKDKKKNCYLQNLTIPWKVWKDWKDYGLQVFLDLTIFTLNMHWRRYEIGTFLISKLFSLFYHEEFALRINMKKGIELWNFWYIILQKINQLLFTPAVLQHTKWELDFVSQVLLARMTLSFVRYVRLTKDVIMAATWLSYNLRISYKIWTRFGISSSTNTVDFEHDHFVRHVSSTKELH